MVTPRLGIVKEYSLSNPAVRASSIEPAFAEIPFRLNPFATTTLKVTSCPASALSGSPSRLIPSSKEATNENVFTSSLLEVFSLLEASSLAEDVTSSTLEDSEAESLEDPFSLLDVPSLLDDTCEMEGEEELTYSSLEESSLPPQLVSKNKEDMTKAANLFFFIFTISFL